MDKKFGNQVFDPIPDHGERMKEAFDKWKSNFDQSSIERLK
jgi:hypothetical protein